MAYGPASAAAGGDWWSQNSPNVIQAPQPQNSPRPLADYGQGGPAGTAAAPTPPPATAAVVSPTAAPAGDPSQYYGKTDPTSVGAWVDQMLAKNGWPAKDRQYYIDTVTAGGGPSAYWDDRLSVAGAAKATAEAGGGGGGTGNFGSLTSAPGTFQAPSGLTEANDPGFMARMKMGTDAIQSSAAAKGSVLSGGTLKALDRYAQDYGSNEYGNVYNRALTGYTTNVGTQRNAQNDYWTRLQSLYGAPGTQPAPA